ncbi:Rv0361 family membrane protein [Filimonas effusa]|uniref:DUF4878 domain-containing protein n=1 Tax=Filimonas effusa TaxID=2508721 RepID=A0A4Q1DDD6_9BACT|nr:DUF4878 domain-containing protein [Filimonas effusa]RXK86673.1 DUF4878 domain-containing protein [Filimonas effusa]
MKQLFLLFLAGFVLAGMVGCKSNGPENTIKKFFHALENKDFAEAKKYATKDSETLLNMLASFPQPADSAKAKKEKNEEINVANVKINGDNATAEVISKDKKAPVTISLKKEEGQWKVAFDKSSVMKMAMDAMPQNGAMPHAAPEVGIDSAVTLPAPVDSTK